MEMTMTMTMTINKDLQIFNDQFPTVQDVLNVFAPCNWGMFVREQDRCIAAPNVTLAMISEYYDSSTSMELVINQYKGLHDLASTTEYNAKSVALAADLFLSSYMNELTPYSTVLYFAKYPATFKTSYRDFDVTDIMQMCRKKFLPWWNQMKAQLAERQAQSEQHTKGVTLQEAIVRWMLQGCSDKCIREGGLYAVGKITDGMIEDARAEYHKRMEGEVF